MNYKITWLYTHEQNFGGSYHRALEFLQTHATGTYSDFYILWHGSEKIAECQGGRIELFGMWRDKRHQTEFFGQFGLTVR